MSSVRLRALPVIAVLVLLGGGSAAAATINYVIGPGSIGAFGASYLHAATTEMGSTGYFVSGESFAIAGTLTITDGMASGFVEGIATGAGSFFGDSTYRINFKNSTTPVAGTPFADGSAELIQLQYSVTKTTTGGPNAGTFTGADGIFRFAHTEFGVADGPNTLGSPAANDPLALWGNNWLNDGSRSANGAGVGNSIGIDMLGQGSVGDTTTPVPDFTSMTQLAFGGLGWLAFIGVFQRRRRA